MASATSENKQVARRSEMLEAAAERVFLVLIQRKAMSCLITNGSSTLRSPRTKGEFASEEGRKRDPDHWDFRRRR